MKQINIIGMGPGNKKSLTYEAGEAIKKAQVIIGSKRLLEDYENPDKKIFSAVTPKEIINN